MNICPLSTITARDVELMDTNRPVLKHGSRSLTRMRVVEW